MIYTVKQRTAYSYDQPVSQSQHILRLLPVNRPGQNVIASHLKILPEPAERRPFTDFFGNAFTSFTLEAAHAKLEIETTARVEVTPQDPPHPALTPGWEVVRDEAAASADMSARGPAHYLFASRMTPLEDAITGYARESFPPGQSVLGGALDFMRRIKQDFRYDTKATTVDTPVRTAFEMKRGVCQDFTHVMICGLRGLGLPAQYVSGFLRTLPPPGKPRLEGADATHAWVNVYCGQAIGWIGLDPTNALVAGPDHIVLALGRDYADVAPVDGVVTLAGSHRVDVKVDVVPLEPANP
jgi:transglutaminase-like putative cysteine protease